MSVEDSPEFKAALQEACEGQYRGWLYGGGIVANSKDKIGDMMEEIQRQRRDIEEKLAGARLRAERIRREAELLGNEQARMITEDLNRLHPSGSGLVCPQCGETNSHGNTMNGKPWCFKCNLPFMSIKKAEKWVKPQKPKPREFTFTDYEKAIIKRTHTHNKVIPKK